MNDQSARQGWEAIVDLALEEDIGTGDVTSQSTVPANTRATATMVAKSAGVISGLDVGEYVFWRVDPSLQFEPLVASGDRVNNRTPIAIVKGNARSILLGERVALNFVQRLSGVATLTSRYVESVGDLPVRVVDTRKTTPGMRLLEKQAVRDGGGHNHRFGLADGVLIKDNHLAAIGGSDPVTAAIEQAREHAPHSLRIEVEVTSLPEVESALEAGADIIMLDNMTTQEMKEAVQLIDGRAIVEASGGITLETIRHVAETGVDIISSGALTHSAPALDISLDIRINGATSTEE